MGTDLITASGSKWDVKRISGVALACLLVGGAIYGFSVYVLPQILTIAENWIKFGILAVVGVFMGMTFLNPKFWRGLRYFSEALSQWTLGMAIEMNPFAILMLKVERAEKDREELGEQAEKLKAQQADLQAQLTDFEQKLQLSSNEMQIASAKMRANPDDTDTELLLETSSTNFNNAKTFIDSVKPLFNDISKLVAFADKAYRKSGNALLNAKNTIKVQKATYDAVTTGSNAMKKAMRAFTGDTNLNNDADIALEKLRKDITGKIGGIKSAIQITSQLMGQKDLTDAAKVQMAVSTVNKFDVDKTFDYSSTINTSATKLDNVNVSNGNKFLDMLNK